ncbi:winged helix-turn-helix transcriptional regulator [Flexivirga sp. ID2601S]|uniref:Winged helix-turn-helix transcriptional regulator n=1 Tax=Flexivirga aerilata TaxID=1656889 RepID=A0A849AAI6_9MICO|nr:MarR family winged helix-turn-helix transcriptional regulator [Flexivirga aerilata]NNG37934.1 winged helix-turn-helix transcriptional regulator [Flexivirga aerilata]
MTEPGRGHELPMLLFAGYRMIVDELHRRLAERGFPDARPADGYALQAISAGASSAVELAGALAVSKQAAGKTLEQLGERGYLQRSVDPGDGRRRTVTLTRRGRDLLAASADAFDEIHREIAGRIGDSALAGVERSLRSLTGDPVIRTDTIGWLGGGPRVP